MTAATVYCYTTCPGPNGCECFDGDGNEKLLPASKYGLTDAQRERDEQPAATVDSRLDLLTPGSLLIERYTYERVRGKTKGVQWCVHEVGKDGSLSQQFVADTRREALAWAAENV